MENDLISRNTLVAAIQEYQMNLFHNKLRLGEIDLNSASALANVERIVCEAPSVEAEPVRHGRWEHVKKHYWRKDEFGNVDMFSYECGYHNGPSCEVCYESFCENCDPDWSEKECTVGHYVCSACGHPEKTNNIRYCPNCGARMDAKEDDHE